MGKEAGSSSGKPSSKQLLSAPKHCTDAHCWDKLHSMISMARISTWHSQSTQRVQCTLDTLNLHCRSCIFGGTSNSKKKFHEGPQRLANALSSHLFSTVGYGNIGVFSTPNFQKETLHFPPHLDQVSYMTAGALLVIRGFVCSIPCLEQRIRKLQRESKQADWQFWPRRTEIQIQAAKDSFSSVGTQTGHIFLSPRHARRYPTLSCLLQTQMHILQPYLPT